MILYFSGTGNCKYVAEQIASAVGDTAVSVENRDGKIALKKGEVLGIVFPTHFWELPAIMREFLEKASITAGGETYAFAIATYGTTPGCSGTDAKKLLRKRGIDLSAAFSLKMPDNWTPMFDLSDAEKVRRQNEEADKNLAVLISNIKAMVKGNHATPKAPYFVRPMSDKLYLKARRTSNFYVEGSCIGCGLCAKQCPVKAIEIQNGKPVWIKEHYVCAACTCARIFPFSTATAKPSSTDSIIIRKNNIDEEKEMKRTQNMISLFLIFMKIGLFTFGGGYAMIPLIQRETVENKKWINDEELLEIIAIAESTPGPIAINAATFIGYRVGGFLGALAATIGLVLPSFAIITAVSFVLAEFQNVRWIQYAFNGIRAGVLALIVKALWSMYKQSPKGIFAYLIMLGAFVVTAFLPVNVIFVILFCAAAGIVQAMIFDRRDKR